MKNNKFSVFGMLAMALGLVFIGCDTGTSGGSGGGGGGDVWSLLIGTWKSDDGNLKYEFEEHGGGNFKMVTVNGSSPYQRWIDFFFKVETITGNKISGDSASFEFVLSDNNRTLTASNFLLLESKANHEPGPINFNGILKKQ